MDREEVFWLLSFLACDATGTFVACKGWVNPGMYIFRNAQRHNGRNPHGPMPKWNGKCRGE